MRAAFWSSEPAAACAAASPFASAPGVLMVSIGAVEWSATFGGNWPCGAAIEDPGSPGSRPASAGDISRADGACTCDCVASGAIGSCGSVTAS